ncbi:MAG: hypothetical protein DRP15_02040 [Candidatus Aenigmatarchaeota archaeon]|nr:MAG: hypothetical protein DRP15_02040 [Candidatus Aenigmarchaeota archaeon]
MEEKGAYCLVIYLSRNVSIRIGSLGTIKFKPGYYCYVGSAMGGLDKRILRHLSDKKKLRWHIDWFLQHAKITDVIRIPSKRRIECLVSKIVRDISDSEIRGFGCTDCKCSSHLYFFRHDPAGKISKVIKKSLPKNI